MKKNNDYNILKDKYGEQFAKFVRKSFPSLLENEGFLSDLIISKFGDNHFLYDDINSLYQVSRFKDYIYSLVDFEKREFAPSDKDPEELLADIGYDLYTCTTEDEVQQFIKYYQAGEELCTFTEGRLKNNFVFFAVKKGAEQLKRIDFSHPKREDTYGRSVLGIQFSRENTNTVDIISRYNHSVSNPNNAYFSNLDNIVPGLTNSFIRKYNLNLTHEKYKAFSLEGYVIAQDGKFYKYNYKINDIYYCSNNTIIDNGKVIELDRSRYLLIDYFIIDMSSEGRSIKLYDSSINDAFIASIGKIGKVTVKKTSNGKVITISTDNGEDIVITIDKKCQIIKYTNKNVKLIGDYFLGHNKVLKEVDLPQAECIGNNFLYANNTMKNVSLPSALKLGYSFIPNNHFIKSISLPKVVSIGNDFMPMYSEREVISLPEVLEIGNNFLRYNSSVSEFYAPRALVIGDDFLLNNCSLTKCDVSRVLVIGDNFCKRNYTMTDCYLPYILKIGPGFFEKNPYLFGKEQMYLEAAVDCKKTEQKKYPTIERKIEHF